VAALVRRSLSEKELARPAGTAKECRFPLHTPVYVIASGVANPRGAHPVRTHGVKTATTSTGLASVVVTSTPSSDTHARSPAPARSAGA
jgi:hypothetical protein